MVLSDATLERLFEEQRPRLLGHAWQLTGSAADAEDAVQEAFLRALRARDGYEERGLGGPWLLRILVNVVRERARRQRFYRGPAHAELEAAAAGGVDPSASPERRAASREGLSRALRQATPEQREVLVLRHFEERSTTEVAGLLGVPEATVRSRLKRARDLVLRACESDEGDER